MNTYSRLFRTLITCLAVALLTGCTPDNMSSGVTMEFQHGPPVPLGGTMTLRAVVHADSDAPDAEIIFELPPGVTVVHGQARQTVQLHKDQTHTIEIQVRLDQPGEQQIGLRVSLQGGSTQLHDGFYLEVSAAGTTVQRDSIFPPPTPEPPPETPMIAPLATSTP